MNERIGAALCLGIWICYAATLIDINVNINVPSEEIKSTNTK